jgi:hypothetical protein
MITCPIYGTKLEKLALTSQNLQFLTAIASEKKTDLAINVTRILWESLPQIGLTAETKEVVGELAKTLVDQTQNQITAILRARVPFGYAKDHGSLRRKVVRSQRR